MRTQVLLTGVFGDGCLPKQGKEFAYNTRCIHREYVEYKRRLLGEGKIKETINSGYKKSPIFVLSTFASPEITTIRNNTYEENLALMNDLGIALWFYDDGSFHRKKHFYNLCTHYFDVGIQREIIAPFLESKLGIKITIRPERKKDGRVFYYCCINKKDGASNITDLLKTYPVECYSYKYTPI